MMKHENNPSVAVVHLIRKKNGLKPFQAFLQSYHQHPDPLAHDLVLIFKDFEPGEDAPYLEILKDTHFVRFDYAGDGGLDLDPYIKVSRTLFYPYFCFLNSFSQIDCDRWLSILLSGFEQFPDAGIVGATGSWESSSETDPPFPNPHIRTNAFLIPAAIMAEVTFIDVYDKDTARAVESGVDGLSRQVKGMGKKLYLADNKGGIWAEEDWPKSGIYRSKRQEGLLVRDNRTQAYEQGDNWTKEYLHDLAWTGKPSKANPLKRHKIRHRLRRLFEKKKPLR
ncbi:hypothetical protein [Sneathiella sp.]|jgi:hypothetical protein|uniref:hypothetical protein n=1 Tax=Sneathiella sp. TaxID=1964365 RepID=UPI0039E3180B